MESLGVPFDRDRLAGFECPTGMCFDGVGVEPYRKALGMITRRMFLAGFGVGCVGGLVASRTQVWAQDSPFESYADPVTGAQVHMLTNNDYQDQVVYQTHPQWSKDQSLLLYSSKRGDAWLPTAMGMKTGVSRPLVDTPVTEVLDVRNNRLLYIHDRTVYATPFAMTAGEVTTLASLPDEVPGLSGGLFVDPVKPVLYVGVVKVADVKWAVMACNLVDATWTTLCDVDFQVGHVQANPEISGEVMFCQETGGDAPQRTWMVADGGPAKPAYKETYEEWVTHEAWWGKDQILFTVWPYDDKHLEMPHGIFSCNVRDGKLTQHAQYKAWHTQGSPDKQWIVGDDFDRNLWLIRVADGERRLLTQGHNGEGFATHPHMSFTPDGKSIVFGSSRNGSNSVFLVDVPEFASLSKA